MMIKPLSLVLLLNIVISALAICPDIPTLATQYTCDNPQYLSSASPGLTNFPSSSFSQLSFSMSVRLDVPTGSGCASTQYTVFMLNTGTKNVAGLYYNVGGDLLVMPSAYSGINSQLPGTGITLTPGTTWLTLYFAADLTTKKVYLELSKEGVVYKTTKTTTATITEMFGPNTKLYLCATLNFANPILCTIKDMMMLYSVDTDPAPYENTRIGGLTPSAAAFFVLNNGPSNSLINAAGTLEAGWLGNTATNPTANTLPTWDSSNAFVSFTAVENIMTFKLPAIAPGVGSNFASFTLSAWVKVTNVVGASATIFKITSADGQQTRGTLEVGSDNVLSVKIPDLATSLDGTNMLMVRNQWKLIGLSVWTTTTKTVQTVTVFVDSDSKSYKGTGAFDLHSTDLLTVGETGKSFIGAVSGVRIISPGSTYVRTSGCSNTAALELGASSFALLCSGSNFLNVGDNKCHATCPANTGSPTGTPIPLCLPCSMVPTSNTCSSGNSGNTGNNGGGSGNTGEPGEGSGNTNNPIITESTSTSSGLNGGQIAGIVVGSVVGVTIMAVGATFLARRRRTTKVQQLPKEEYNKVSRINSEGIEA